MVINYQKGQIRLASQLGVGNASIGSSYLRVFQKSLLKGLLIIFEHILLFFDVISDVYSLKTN